MITIKTTIYKCDFCKKVYLKKKWAEKHELGCTKNPANDRPCFHCRCLETKEFELGEDDPENGDYMYRLNILHCRKRDVFLYPPKVELKGTAYDLEDERNEPMPMSCEHLDGWSNG